MFSNLRKKAADQVATHSGGSDKSQDPDSIDFDDLAAKLKEAEGRIRVLISGTIPKVQVELPRLSASAFGPAAPPPDAQGVQTVFGQDELPVGGSGSPLLSPRRQVLLGSAGPDGIKVAVGADAAASQALAQAEAMEAGLSERAALLEAEARAHVAEARDHATAAVEGVRAAAEARGRVFVEQVAGKLLELKAPLLTGALSLWLVFVAAVAGLGPIAAVVLSVVASTVGFYSAMYDRAHGFRNALMQQFDDVLQKVMQSIGKAKEVLLGMSEQVLRAIDDICEEQKPALDKVAQLEGTLKIDVPDPGDMKKPLEACKDKLVGFAKEVEEQVPTSIREMFNSLAIGKVVNNVMYFNLLAVVLPSFGVFVVNCSVGAVQVALQVMRTSSSVQEVAAGVAASRRLDDAGIVEDAESVVWADYLQPWAVQMLLMLLQVAVAREFASAPRLVPHANAAIEKLEVSASEKINGKLQESVDVVMKKVFDEVKEKCDAFFPKFQDVLHKAKEVQEKAKKVAALAGGLKGLKGVKK